jgi:uncharacterized protein YecE (DUF72 family)
MTDLENVHVGTSGWAGAFSAWLNRGTEVFCYFDNDEAGYAVQNALRLQGMMRTVNSRAGYHTRRDVRYGMCDVR